MNFLDIYQLEVNVFVIFDSTEYINNVNVILCYFLDKESYNTLTENQVAEILRDVTADTFSSVKEKIAEIVEEKLLENKD